MNRSVGLLFPRASSVRRCAALTSAVVLIASASAAHAGVNIWTSNGPVSPDGRGPDVSALAIDPVTPNNLYAGADAVYKSTDAGACWSPTGLLNFPVHALAIDPAAPNTVYAGTWNAGIYKSTDGGANWSAANTGLPDNSLVTVLAIDPATSSTVYVGVGTLDGGTFAGVYKSIDGGASWMTTGLIGAPLSGISAVASISAVAIDPKKPSTLYAGVGLWCPASASVYAGVDESALSLTYKSTDGGTSWIPSGTGLVGSRCAAVNALVIDPAMPNTVYAGVLTAAGYGFAQGGVFSVQQVAAVCVGDCGGTDAVAVNDIITLVNIALGNAQASTCPNGVPIGVTVDVALITQAANNALNGCAGS